MCMTVPHYLHRNRVDVAQTTQAPATSRASGHMGVPLHVVQKAMAKRKPLAAGAGAGIGAGASRNCMEVNVKVPNQAQKVQDVAVGLVSPASAS